MSKKKSVIVGYDAVSPLGTELQDQWQRAVNGESGIGELTRFDLDFFGSLVLDSDEIWIFELEGNRGSGQLTGEFEIIDLATENFAGGTLVLDSGETFELVPVGG